MEPTPTAAPAPTHTLSLTDDLASYPPVCTVYVPPQVPPTRDPRLPQPTPIAIWDGDHGAATASLEERICAADTIVLASLASAAVGELRFRAIEYLHDTGPAVFTVLASTPDRPTQWDDREAVLFLARSEDGGAEFKFADTTKWNYLGTRTNIAWVYGGEGIEGYDSCLRSGLAEIRFIRDREAYDGEPLGSDNQRADTFRARCRRRAV